MFRLIGIIVVVAVVIISFSSLQKWYEGRATPAETITNIRDQVGTALKPTINNDGETYLDEVNQESSPEEIEPQKHFSSEEFSTEDAARELIKFSDD